VPELGPQERVSGRRAQGVGEASGRWAPTLSSRRPPSRWRPLSTLSSRPSRDDVSGWPSPRDLLRNAPEEAPALGAYLVH
jgi:hypothetical protein